MITEREYIKKTSIDHRKKFAQFFTPERISDFMALWILEGTTGKAKILDPAFGLGVFARSLYKLNPHIGIVGYDIDETIYKYASKGFAGTKYDVVINNDNYLTTSWSEKFDGIICNPPYLKFHDYDNTTLVPIVNNNLHINLNGFTNIYTLFLLKSIYQMKDGGRMAYIIPSEFLNSDYGVEVKRALLQSGVVRHIIIVDYTRCAFDDALTTACILLCQKDDHSKDIKFSVTDNIDNIAFSLTNYKSIRADYLNPDIKWKQYYEHTQTSKYNHLVPFSTFAKVSRGIATGANDYFTFKASEIDTYNIPKSCFFRCICHSVDVSNLIFTDSDFEYVSNQDKTVYLFNGCADNNDPHVRKYICLGEKKGVDKKYLTASRKPWYALENRKPSPIWVSVFNRNGLRFVRNKAAVHNLTTFHCVYNVGTVDTDILFAYLVTDVAEEIFMDNSRQYGNGLVKFEPNDLNKGSVVDLRMLTVEENAFVRRASEMLQYFGTVSERTTGILGDFFRDKYIDGHTDLPFYIERLEGLLVEKTPKKQVSLKAVRCKQLNLYDLFEQSADRPFVENCSFHEDK